MEGPWIFFSSSEYITRSLVAWWNPLCPSFVLISPSIQGISTNLAKLEPIVHSCKDIELSVGMCWSHLFVKSAFAGILTRDWRRRAIFPAPSRFLRYLPKLRTDHREIFITFSKPSILYVLTKGKLASFDTSDINVVRVTACFFQF